jgi:hypothetical protein
MQSGFGSERYVLCPEQIVLECWCRERLILLGREEDWYLEGRTVFECHKCGGQLTLADRSDEGSEPALIGSSSDEAMNVRELIRSLRAAEGS